MFDRPLMQELIRARQADLDGELVKVQRWRTARGRCGKQVTRSTRRWRTTLIVKAIGLLTLAAAGWYLYNSG